MREDLKQQILRYLTRHPGARDSAEGIRVWWLERDTSATRADVEQALGELVSIGWVEDRGEGSVHLFGLLPSAAHDIQRYLTEGSPALG